MRHIDDLLSDSLDRRDEPRVRPRPPPLPPMRLGRLSQAGLIGLRLILGLTTAMAVYAAFHGLHA